MSLRNLYAQRDYKGLSSVTETSQLSNVSMAGIILLFFATDNISSSLFKILPYNATTQSIFDQQEKIGNIKFCTLIWSLWNYRNSMDPKVDPRMDTVRLSLEAIAKTKGAQDPFMVQNN